MYIHFVNMPRIIFFILTYVLWIVERPENLVVSDPNIRTREEAYTPLHFAARYIPRIVNKELQQQETDASAHGAAVEVGKLSNSAQAMQFLVNLKKNRKVKVC